ncbi:MAG: hypothetical protein WB949_15420 [Candidatus Acidiferrales bacterium]
MNEKAHQALSAMSDAEFDQLALRLGWYALSVSRGLYWRTGNPEELPGGETVTSIVSKAIAKTISGERNWNPETDPSLGKYLMDVIDSLLNQLATSYDNTKFAVIPDRYDGDGNPMPEVRPSQPPVGAEWLAYPSQDPEAKILAAEKAEMDQRAVDALIVESDSEPHLKRVLEAIFDGCENPRSIAEKTGLTRTDVYNAKKRLATKAAAIRRRLSPGEASRATKGKQDVD